jgi:hypothetical protein
LADEAGVVNGRIQWQLIKPEQTVTYGSLADLVDDVQQTRSGAAHL